MIEQKKYITWQDRGRAFLVMAISGQMPLRVETPKRSQCSLEDVRIRDWNVEGLDVESDRYI